MFSLPEYEYQSQRVTIHKSLVVGQWNTLAELDGPGIIKHIWVTLPAMDKHFTRKNIIRIFWDDEEQPSVEAPIGDFFGVPMGLSGAQYQLNSYFITVLPKNGLNSYFPMPFGKKARIELFVEQTTSAGGFYFQCDYEKCTNGLPEQWKDLRFHAKYRMESTESYGHRYLVLDAEGEGYFVGATFGIRALKELPDSWYHGGGDLIAIDGETDPHIMHGIGAEDFFGHSWGTDISSSLYMGNPLFEQIETDERNFLNLVLYRFFVQDPIRFKSSLRIELGAIGANMSSVAYWYQKKPHREFFTLPRGQNLLQDSDVPRLSYDIMPEYTHTWNVYGPINNVEDQPFDKIQDWEQNAASVDLSMTTEFHPNKDSTVKVTWKTLQAPRGFLDFIVAMRPDILRIVYPTDCYGYALGYVNLTEDFTGSLRLGFDDRMKLYVDDELLLDSTHSNGFEHVSIPVKLSKGKHTILIKLSNTHNNNFRAFTSHLAFVDETGQYRKDIVIDKL